MIPAYVKELMVKIYYFLIYVKYLLRGNPQLMAQGLRFSHPFTLRSHDRHAPAMSFGSSDLEVAAPHHLRQERVLP